MYKHYLPYNCKDNKYYLEKGCFKCKYKEKGCDKKHICVDSTVFLRMLLGEKGCDKAEEFLDSIHDKKIIYLTATQIAHIIRRLLKEKRDMETKGFKKYKTKDKDYPNNAIKVFYEDYIPKIQILIEPDDDNTFKKIYTEIQNLTELRSEFHDKLINLPLIIDHKLDLALLDKDFEGDIKTKILEISKNNKNYNIKIVPI